MTQPAIFKQPLGFFFFAFRKSKEDLVKKIKTASPNL